MTYPPPDKKFFEDYTNFMLSSGNSINTAKEYILKLKLIPGQPKKFFSDFNLKGRRLKIAAYRSYLTFLYQEKQLISREELLNALDTFKTRKRRGNNHSERKYAIPKTEWDNYIRKAPTRVAKFGLWLGFNFGLRLNEILHLRIQDIDFENQEIHIRAHQAKKNQEFWEPKYNRSRNLPFTIQQSRVFQRWIEERPQEIKHQYLLYTVRGRRKHEIVQARAFQRWCKVVDKRLHPHILRYSFATHFYNESKDVKLISELLGHANVSTTSDYLQLGSKETMSKGRELFSK